MESKKINSRTIQQTVTDGEMLISISPPSSKQEIDAMNKLQLAVELIGSVPKELRHDAAIRFGYRFMQLCSYID